MYLCKCIYIIEKYFCECLPFFLSFSNASRFLLFKQHQQDCHIYFTLLNVYELKMAERLVNSLNHLHCISYRTSEVWISLRLISFFIFNMALFWAGPSIWGAKGVRNLNNLVQTIHTRWDHVWGVWLRVQHHPAWWASLDCEDMRLTAPCRWHVWLWYNIFQCFWCVEAAVWLPGNDCCCNDARRHWWLVTRQRHCADCRIIKVCAFAADLSKLNYVLPTWCRFTKMHVNIKK